MEKINIRETGTTPLVILDKENGVFKFEGKTLPENVNIFYQPIVDWFNEYIENPNEETILETKLEYINTASSKALFSIFLKLEQLVEKGHKVKMQWYYADDDEDMKDVGEEYEDVIKIPFEHIEYEAED
jgi:hypothetical protein